MATAFRAGTSETDSKTYHGTSGADYDSLGTWEIYSDVNHVSTTTSYRLRVEAGSHVDSVTLADSTSNATYFRRITADTGAGHGGLLKTDGSVAHIKSSDQWKGILIQEPYTQVQGLVLSCTHASYNGGLIYFQGDAEEAAFVGCFATSETSSGNEYGIKSYNRSDSATAFAIDCLVEGTQEAGCAAESQTVGVKNVLIIDCGGTYGVDESGGTAECVNVIVDNSGSSADYDSAVTMTTCGSTDTSGSAGLQELSLTYANEGGGDYTPGSDSEVVGEGTNLSSTGDYQFDDDAEEVAWSGTWDLGPLKYVAAGGGQPFHIRDNYTLPAFLGIGSA